MTNSVFHLALLNNSCVLCIFYVVGIAMGWEIDIEFVSK